MKEIEIHVDQKSRDATSDITGNVTVHYDGRFDGVQMNTYLTGGSGQVIFVELNGKKISLQTRLFISKDQLTSNNTFTFGVKVNSTDYSKAKVRLRATIIQEHKEVASDVVFIPLNQLP